jgi:hypothetical protein
MTHPERCFLNTVVCSWAGDVARMEKNRIANMILVRKPEGNRPLGRARRRWVDNIKIDRREIG